jgi:nucleotide-binding universal stress UspA family protein
MPRAFHVGIHFGEAVAELEQFGRGAVSDVRKMAERRGLECEEIVAEGPPHESIILVSNDIGADLVVVGSTGVTGLERVLIGSVSQKVLLHSERPVLLVRGP